VRRAIPLTAIAAALVLAATALGSKQFFSGPTEQQPDATVGFQIVKNDGKVVKVQAFGSQDVKIDCQISGEVQLGELTTPGSAKVKQHKFNFRSDSDEGNNGHFHLTGTFNKTYKKVTGIYQVEFDYGKVTPNPADHCDTGDLDYTATKDANMP
jgi:hypothetical protein